MEFREFTSLDESTLRMILAWRNDERITPFFVHKSVGEKEHFDFIKALKNDKSKRYFLVSDESTALGVVNFVNITQNCAEFGLYQNPNLRGFGRVLLENLTKFAFENLRLKTLTARAFNENERAINLYLNFGFSCVKKDEKMSYFALKNAAKNENGGGDFLIALNFTLLKDFKVFKNRVNFVSFNDLKTLKNRTNFTPNFTQISRFKIKKNFSFLRNGANSAHFKRSVA